MERLLAQFYTVIIPAIRNIITFSFPSPTQLFMMNLAWPEPTNNQHRPSLDDALALFSDAQLEGVSKILGDARTGSDITRVFDIMGIVDNSGMSTKWKRLYGTFAHYQNTENSPSRLIDFIKHYLEPVAFCDKPVEFEEYRQKLNNILIFVGLEYGEDGQFRRVEKATTLSEAQRRLQTVQKKFQGRRLHNEVTKYCKEELFEENYFHAVFEATKGLAERIRQLSGQQLDGAELVDKVFSINRPLLALNTLTTETERSEHKGFAMLLKGCFAAVRNPLAHQPKILWEGEDDTADYLSMISLLHRKLDEAVSSHLMTRY